MKQKKTKATTNYNTKTKIFNQIYYKRKTFQKKIRKISKENTGKDR